MCVVVRGGGGLGSYSAGDQTTTAYFRAVYFSSQKFLVDISSDCQNWIYFNDFVTTVVTLGYLFSCPSSKQFIFTI